MRKSQFSTLTDLNPGFGGPWDMLEIFFVNVIFIMLKSKLEGALFYIHNCKKKQCGTKRVVFKKMVLMVLYLECSQLQHYWLLSFKFEDTKLGRDFFP